MHNENNIIRRIKKRSDKKCCCPKTIRIRERVSRHHASVSQPALQTRHQTPHIPSRTFSPDTNQLHTLRLASPFRFCHHNSYSLAFSFYDRENRLI